MLNGSIEGTWDGFGRRRLRDGRDRCFRFSGSGWRSFSSSTGSTFGRTYEQHLSSQGPVPVAMTGAAGRVLLVAGAVLHVVIDGESFVGLGDGREKQPAGDRPVLVREPLLDGVGGLELEDRSFGPPDVEVLPGGVGRTFHPDRASGSIDLTGLDPWTYLVAHIAIGVSWTGGSRSSTVGSTCFPLNFLVMICLTTIMSVIMWVVETRALFGPYARIELAGNHGSETGCNRDPCRSGAPFVSYPDYGACEILSRLQSKGRMAPGAFTSLSGGFELKRRGG